MSNVDQRTLDFYQGVEPVVKQIQFFVVKLHISYNIEKEPEKDDGWRGFCSYGSRTIEISKSVELFRVPMTEGPFFLDYVTELARKLYTVDSELVKNAILPHKANRVRIRREAVTYTQLTAPK